MKIMFMNDWIKVGMPHRKTALVKIFDISETEDQRIAKAIIQAEGPDGQITEYGTRGFGVTTFRIIENLTGDKGFHIGSVKVYEPSKMVNEAWTERYTTPEKGNMAAVRHARKVMEDLKIAVKIGYMACVGVHDNQIHYMKEDRFGQSCNKCDRLRRPAQGNPDIECMAGMFDPWDTHEGLKEDRDVVTWDSGRYFAEGTINVKETVMEAIWLQDIDKLEDAVEQIAHGLYADRGGISWVEQVPIMMRKALIDQTDPDERAVSEAGLREELEDSGADPIYAKLLLGQTITKEDYLLYPRTISHFYEVCVPEEKGYSMTFLGDDLFDAYKLDMSFTPCGYGRNDTHPNGYLTHQIDLALEIRASLSNESVPQIKTATSDDKALNKGYIVVDADQPALAPSAEIVSLPNDQFILAYVQELRTRFATLKSDLERIASHDKILVVSSERAVSRSGIGFDIANATVDIDTYDIEPRHVLAWVLAKISPRHEISKTNA